VFQRGELLQMRPWPVMRSVDEAAAAMQQKHLRREDVQKMIDEQLREAKFEMMQGFAGVLRTVVREEGLLKLADLAKDRAAVLSLGSAMADLCGRVASVEARPQHVGVRSRVDRFEKDLKELMLRVESLEEEAFNLDEEGGVGFTEEAHGARPGSDDFDLQLFHESMDEGIEHWKEYGRNYYARYDYVGVDKAKTEEMMEKMSEMSIGGTTVLGMQIKSNDVFEYKDLVDGSGSKNQGIRIMFEDGSRIIFCLSGTGVAGATVRLYLEKCEPATGDLGKHQFDVVKPLADIALQISKLREFTGRDIPTVITGKDQFVEGAYVLVQSLVSRVELNGLVGMLKLYHEEQVGSSAEHRGAAPVERGELEAAERERSKVSAGTVVAECRQASLMGPRWQTDAGTA